MAVQLLFSGLSANAFMVPAPVFAPARANFPSISMGVIITGDPDATRDEAPETGIRASVMGPDHVGVENTWRPHDSKGKNHHKGTGQPMIEGLTVQAVMEKSVMAAKKSKVFSKDLKHDGLDTW